MRRRTAMGTLALRVAIGLGVAALVVLLDGVAGLRVDPTIAVLTAVAVAVATWVVTYLEGPRTAPQWEQPMWRTRSPRFHADVRTRRLASVLSHSQPGQAFDATTLARYLAELTARRLVVSGRVTAEDPLGQADGILSPKLLAYLRSAQAERPQVLKRKTLHAHLKEIDSL